MSDSPETDSAVRENQFTLRHLLGLMVLTALCLGLAKWSEGEAGPYVFCLAGPIAALLSLGHRRGESPSGSLADGGIASGVIWAATTFTRRVSEASDQGAATSVPGLFGESLAFALFGGVVGVVLAAPIVGGWLFFRWLGAQIPRPSLRKETRQPECAEPRPGFLPEKESPCADD